MNNHDRRLIEDYLPIEELSKEASREKSSHIGHISTLHLWWARRPLVACRAAVFGALVPAPVAKNGRGPKSDFVKRLCKYPGDPAVIKLAQQHILEAHAERLSKETGKTITMKDIEEGRAPRPRVLDMFAGGGSIPLEALRLGCEAYALELNPVAHLIELCTLVYPQKYGKLDKNVKGSAPDGTWAGLANEVEYWGQWVFDRVEEEIEDLYPPIKVPRTLIEIGRQERIEGKAQDFVTLTPVAYLWTRTVRCKKPACNAIVPLVKQTWLYKKKGKYIALRMDKNEESKCPQFLVVHSKAEIESVAIEEFGFNPAKFSKRGNATCLFCGTVADDDYVKSESRNKRLQRQIMAVACTMQNAKGKIYFGADDFNFLMGPSDNDIWKEIENLCKDTGLSLPEEPMDINDPTTVAGRGFGYAKWYELFTPRQILTLLTFIKWIRKADLAVGMKAYNENQKKALMSYLGLWIDRIADHGHSFCHWHTTRATIESPIGNKRIPMVWDYPETNPLGNASGNAKGALKWIKGALDNINNGLQSGDIIRGSATFLPYSDKYFDAIITDPPYYGNVNYSILSDFFYVWLKRSIGYIYPEHFAGELSPKKNEAVANSSRHNGSGEIAKKIYEELMFEAFKNARKVLKPYAPLVTIYAHKTTAGWSTLVDSLRRAGFFVIEAWPLQVEMEGREQAREAAALASNILLVACRLEGSETGSYDAVKPELENIVRERVETLWKEGISGADLVIAAVGAGLRAFTRYAKVEYPNGEEVPAEKFLSEVEGAVLETLLEKIFNVPRSGVAGVDTATRFYVLWRFTYKYAEIDAGEAIVFAYPQGVELDGPKGLSSGVNSLLEKKKKKYRLRDFAERGSHENLGFSDNGTHAPLIDSLHRILWLMENQPFKINEFLEKTSPPAERLRLVAQALKGHTLGGSAEGISAPEQTSLGKLLANWRSVIEEGLVIKRAQESERKVSKQMRLGVE